MSAAAHGPSRRMDAVATPIIPTVAAWATARPDALSLGQGVAWYGPPPEALARVEAFLARAPAARDRYGPVQGLPELVALLTQRLREDLGYGDPQGRVLVTAGANMAFLQCLLAVTDPGDEVILCRPWYFNHDMAVALAGCRSIPVDTDGDFLLDPDAVAAAIGPRTRAIVTVSPCNPTGVVQPAQRLDAVNDLAARHGLWHFSDETYAEFTFTGEPHHAAGTRPGALAHTIPLYSLSKAYGFASWRIGCAIVPESLYPALLKVQDTNLICAAHVAQEAAIGALEHGPAWCRGHLAGLARTREALIHALEGLHPQVRVPPAGGAFYLLPRIEGIDDDLVLVRRLIERHGIVTIPGSAFGVRGGTHLRLSYGALEPAAAPAAIARLVAGLAAELAG